MSRAIETRDLVKVYADGAIRALDGVNLSLDEGRCAVIMGPSGCGKTTLLHMIGALDRPTSGEILLFGRPLEAADDLDSVRAREIGFVFQLHNLIPVLTAGENVEIPMMALGTPRGERRRRAEELLEAVGLSTRLHARAATLSGGERQRAAIARALANRPRLILADEPTGSVDSRTGGQILSLLRGLQRDRGITLVIVTHNPALAEPGDQGVEMQDGRIRPPVTSA